MLSSLTVFNLVSTDMAIRSADRYHALRKQDITIRKTADVIIANFCIEKGLPLLHSGRDFLPFHRHLGLRNALI